MVAIVRWPRIFWCLKKGPIISRIDHIGFTRLLGFLSRVCRNYGVYGISRQRVSRAERVQRVSSVSRVSRIYRVSRVYRVSRILSTYT